jgi:hypothetical protein
MRNNLDFIKKYIEDQRSGVEVEVADFSSTDYEFAQPVRYFKCSAGGVLRVDLVGGQEDVDILVTAGINPESITKIYNSGSDAITVHGFR